MTRRPTPAKSRPKRHRTIQMLMPDGRRERVTVAPGSVNLESEDVRLGDGTRLTNAKVDAIVAEIHRRHPGGRPSLTGRAAVSPRISFRIAPELRQRAERLAKRKGKSLSALAREAFEHAVKP